MRKTSQPGKIQDDKRPQNQDVGTVRWNIPSSWCWAKVSEVGAVRLGRQRSPGTASGRYPTKYLRAGNITATGLDLREVLEMDFDPVERQVYALHSGDVVVAEASGSASQVGRAAIWLDEIPNCCFQNTVIRFRPHAVVPEYALLVFQHLSLSGAFAAAARGVGIQHLGGSGFGRVAFPLPPLAEQVRISVEAARQLREAIEARGAIENALRRTVEQDDMILEAAALGGLVDSGASGPAASRAADEIDGQPELFAMSGKQTRRARVEIPELTSRAIPPSWKWIRVDDAGEVRLGRQRSPEHEYGEHMVPYLRVANVFENHIDTSDVRSMNFTLAEQETFRLRKGDILLNEGQSPELVGRPAMYVGVPPRVCYQNTLVRFRHARHVDAEFALLVFRHYLRAGHFTRIARWSTNIAHLGSDRFASMPFPLAPHAEQQKVVAEARVRLDASEAQRAALGASLNRLRDMRAEIIRSAVSGALVPQLASDEPASDLLTRLGPPLEPKPQTRGKERRMTRRAKGSEEPKPLYETLRGLKTAATPDLLFKAAGYNPDSVADVEKFYLALRDEVGSRIRARASGAGLRLEVITDAA